MRMKEGKTSLWAKADTKKYFLFYVGIQTLSNLEAMHMSNQFNAPNAKKLFTRKKSLKL